MKPLEYTRRENSRRFWRKRQSAWGLQLGGFVLLVGCAVVGCHKQEQSPVVQTIGEQQRPGSLLQKIPIIPGAVLKSQWHMTLTPSMKTRLVAVYVTTASFENALDFYKPYIRGRYDVKHLNSAGGVFRYVNELISNVKLEFEDTKWWVNISERYLNEDMKPPQWSTSGTVKIEFLQERI